MIDAKPTLQQQGTRPRVRGISDCTPPKPIETTVELIERLNGGYGSASSPTGPK